MLLPPALVLLVLALSSPAATADARWHIFTRPRHFTRDVRATLTSLLSRAPVSPSPARKRALASSPGKCLAVAPGQFPFTNPANGTVDTPSPPGSGSGSGSSGTQVPTSGGAPPSSRPSSPRPGPTSPPAPPPPPAPPANPSGSSPWREAQYYAGNDFFNGWDFYTDPDPTHGTVQYVSEDTARTNGLVSVNDAGNAIMRVETTPQVANTRMSVRITTQYSYTGALIILDAVHMPVGCATWPAFWSNGPHWPDNGEIDIVEGVNNQVNNQATIHTRAGCTIPNSPAAVGATGAQVNGNNCDVAATGNAGCGTVLSDADGPNYGSAFNAAGGGVYAMLWDDQAISVWWFPRAAGVPGDITSRAPKPQNWGTPWARWPGTTCDTMTFFRNHNTIFDTTLCGDWAGGVWGQTCAAQTGVANCADFVKQRGDAFADAYWEVKSVGIYQKS